MKKIRASKLKKLRRKKNEIYDKNLKYGKFSENNIKLKKGRDKAKNHLIFEKLYNNESNIETISKMSKMFLNKSNIKYIEKIYKTKTSRQKSPLKKDEENMSDDDVDLDMDDENDDKINNSSKENNKEKKKLNTKNKNDEKSNSSSEGAIDSDKSSNEDKQKIFQM